MIIKDEEICKQLLKSIEILTQLRGKKGCPWDREQNLMTLKKHLIEETYEVVEAIDKNDMNSLKIELGDLLLQVLFQSKIVEEDGEFSFLDVIINLNDKLIRRHPHVYGETNAANPKDVKLIWNKVKAKEKEENNINNSKTLNHNKSQSALLQALELQEQASNVGFDWEEIEPVFDKIDEEISEIKDALKSEDEKGASQELGDLLFATVNLARFIDSDPEVALLGTINRFIERFEYIEAKASENNLVLNKMDLLELESLWQEAKLQTRR